MLIAVLSVYLLGILALSVYAARKIQNEEDYLVAGRRLPLSLAWGTLLATWFGAATVLGAAEAARSEGVRGTILDPFASGISLILAGLFFAKPLWEMRLLTMGDFYARIYGKRSELLASVILVPGYFGWIAGQFVALAGLQHTFFGIDPTIGVLLAASLILVYTMSGGMWSVTLTDTLQIVIVLISLIVLGATTFGQFGDGSVTGGIDRLIAETSPEHLTLLPAAGTAALVGWLATLGTGLFGNIPGQDLMQRVFASKDSKTAVRACILAGVVYVLFGLLPVGMGLLSRLLVPHDTKHDILGILAQQYLSPTMSTVFVVALVSVIVSTCTSAVLAPAAILGHNLLGRLPGFKQRRLFTDRLSVFLVTVGGVVMAFLGETILGLLELSLGIVFVALFVPLVAGLYTRPRGELGALLSMGGGFLVWLVREVMERFLLAMPTNLAETTDYADFVAARFPAAEFGTLLNSVAYSFALLPSAISGTFASLLGYLLGHFLSRKSA